MNVKRSWSVVLMLLVGLAGAVSAQDSDNPYDLPEDLLPFWKQYWPAKNGDDEGAMDKAVRLDKELAGRTLDLLLDDISMRDDADLPSELRTLAWSLDRVDGQTRYIERVRLVLDLSLPERRARSGAMRDLNTAFGVLEEARLERSENGWLRTLRAFEKALSPFEQLGDHEFSILCLQWMADMEANRGRPWERSQLLKRITELAPELDYKEQLAEQARAELGRLLEAGIDPDKPKPAGNVGPAEGEGADAGADDAGGFGLTSWTAGSETQRFEFGLEVPKKGLGGVSLPTFAPADNYYLWPVTWIDVDGPSEFDSSRTVKVQPFASRWKISRAGNDYSFDVDDDGEADVSFSLSSNPQRVDVPSPDGSETYPLMVAVPSDREQMFGLEVNYSPQQNGARVRFNIGGYLEGKVLGETWKVYDSNITGRYGDAIEVWDDLYTKFEDDDSVHFVELDSVIIGKAKTAIPWSSVLPVGDGFYRADIAANGKELSLRELNLQTGAIKLDIDTSKPPEFLIVQEVGKLEGAFFNLIGKKRGAAVTVPAGTYRVVAGAIRVGKKTSMKQVRIYTGDSAAFDVGPGETYELDLGAPFKMEIDGKQDGDEFVIEGASLRVFGRGGEEYALFFDDPLQPIVDALTSDGKKLAKGEKMPRTDISAWQTGPAETIWFPMNLHIPNPKKAPVTLILKQKSHALLGGPFESQVTP